jgi:CheY-like chemotaxis protein
MLQVKLINSAKETLILKKIEAEFFELRNILEQGSEAKAVAERIHECLFAELLTYRKIIGFNIHDSMASYVRAVQSSLKGETVKFTAKPTYLSAVFRAVNEKYASLLENNEEGYNITFTMDLHKPDVGIKILDIYMINIFENLLTNSIRKISSHKGEKWIKVSTEEKVIDESVFILIYWTDNGPGVEDSRKQTIFEGDSDKSDEGDHGIGLSDIKMLIETLGGFIKETGIYGEGVRFVIGLPMIEDDCQGITTHINKDTFEFDPRIRNMKVLVVDDDNHTILGYSNFFSNAKMKKVRHAYNGEQAREMILKEEFVPDVLINEIDMKIVDGIGLIKSLAAHSLNIPVLVVSGTLSKPSDENNEKLEILKKCGVIAKIDKPVDFHLLFDLTQSTLLDKYLTDNF